MGFLRQRLSTVPSGVRLLSLYTLAVGLGGSIHSGLITPFGRSLGMTPGSIGLYYTTFSLVSVASSFAGGLLSTRYGNRSMLVAGRSFAVVQLVLFAVTRDWRFLLFAALMRGMADLEKGPVMAVTAELATDRNRATVFGFVNMLQSAAAALGPLVGGFVADKFGPRVAFTLCVPVLLLAVYVARVFPVARYEPEAAVRAAAGDRQTPPGTRRKESLVRVVMRPEYGLARLVLAFAILNGVHNSFITLVMPLWVQDRFGVAYTGVSGLGAASALGTMATALIGGRLADKYGKGRVAGSFGISGMALWFLFGRLGSLPKVYGLFFWSSLIANTGAPGYWAMAVESVPATERSTLMGTFGALFAISFGIMNALVGHLYSMDPARCLILFNINIALILIVVALTVIKASRKAPGPVEAQVGSG